MHLCNRHFLQKSSFTKRALSKCRGRDNINCNLALDVFEVAVIFYFTPGKKK